MKNSQYYPEIDGLRAIAVLSVLVYHAGIDIIPGGFIGVDIFYVISGYLITKILVSSLQTERFFFSHFYIRRIKRLLPAVLVLIVATIIFGFIILTPEEYIKLAKSAIYSNLFIANVWFMNNSGYFDLPTQVSPLAHMWSLAVEEQFYLIYPILLVTAYRIKKINGVKLLIILTLLVSFLLNILISKNFPNFSFYMLATRAWELSLGAILVFIPTNIIHSKAISSAIAFIGFTTISYGLIFITHDHTYPGYYALLPTIGSALLIFSSTLKSNIFRSFLSQKPIVFIGKISYSVYLWHWCIFRRR